MNEELMNQLAEDYVKNVVSAFKIVAAKAYKDGLQDAMKIVRQRLEMENTEFDYGHNVTRREDD